MLVFLANLFIVFHDTSHVDDCFISQAWPGKHPTVTKLISTNITCTFQNIVKQSPNF